MLYSVVDLGSNSVRLCVYSYEGQSLKKMFHKKIMAGLANFIEGEKFSKKGISKACIVLKEFRNILLNLQMNIEDTHVFATASLRNIVNATEAMEEIQSETGFQVKLLSGEEEATLGFKGAITNFDHSDGILIDIGGGSTEIVIFNNKQIEFATSLSIGSLNLYLNVVNKIIPKPDERKIMKKIVRDELTKLNLDGITQMKICGVGGTIRATSKLNNAIYGLPLHHNEVTVSQIKIILQQLKNSKKSTINPITQNIPDRIHTVIPGMIILHTIADYFECEDIVVSQYGIREGYVLDRMVKKAGE